MNLCAHLTFVKLGAIFILCAAVTVMCTLNLCRAVTVVCSAHCTLNLCAAVVCTCDEVIHTVTSEESRLCRSTFYDLESESAQPQPQARALGPHGSKSPL